VSVTGNGRHPFLAALEPVAAALGAFMLRRSVEDVADALGVSRITVYNYLNAMRGEPLRPA
jgi:predicted transcriptional regulator YheO